MGLPAAGIRANLEKIIDACLGSGARVLLAGFLSLRGFYPDYTRSFHAIYTELSRSRQVPLIPDFMPGIPQNPSLTLPDGIHPNEKGVDRIVEHVLPYLRVLLEKMVISGSMFSSVAEPGRDEMFEDILKKENVRIERIISRGHSTQQGEWYDQPRDEWVLLLQGKAAVLVEGEDRARVLKPGDYIHLPARIRHRVDWTSRDETCIWLAVHFDATGPDQ